MYGWRGMLSGALALVVLQAVVSSDNAANSIGGVFGFANWVALRLIDPKVPAIRARTAAPLAPPAGATFSGISKIQPSPGVGGAGGLGGALGVPGGLLP